jgi:uncharacterized protein DUF5666
MGPRIFSLVAKRTPCLSWLSLALTIGFAVFATGCGGASGGGTTLKGNTAVVVLATSTANDQLSQFPLALKSLTLTSRSGTTVTLISTPVSAEFIHLNGNLEPLASVSIPEDVYTAATAVEGGTAPVCVGVESSGGGLLIDGAINGPGTQPITVNLPQPITVSGSAMGLVLNLQVPQSAPFSGSCAPNLEVPVAPVFALTPMVIAAQPTNSTNGQAFGLEGVIGSLDGSGGGFAVTAPVGYWNGYPPTWQVTVNGSTAFQGVGNSAGLSAGVPVDMDVALQADGTLQATRVAVYDTDTSNLSFSSGQITLESPSESEVYGLTAQIAGDLPAMSDVFGYSDATFSTSGQFTNVPSLPFAASFNAGSTVGGQNILVNANASPVDGLPPLPLPAATMMLMPQTLDGTVSAISTQGAFTAYTVTLAPYDLFPVLSAQPGQPTLLTNPNTVTVYADNNTQMLSAPAVGGVFRFYGLVFNDNGSLKMDCAQVNDGVAE